MSLIALLTDFGTTDSYVGVMKGVMHGIAPHIPHIDLTHGIPAQNVRRAALTLLNSYRYFPSGTVFLVIVDPDEDAEPHPIVAHIAGDRSYTFVAPDNGVLTYVLSENPHARLIAATNPDYWLSAGHATFHGRDVFAPLTAHIAAGIALDALGTPLSEPRHIPMPALDIAQGHITGEIVHIDHFGNLTTSIGHFRWINPERLSLTPRFTQVQPVSFSVRAQVMLAGHAFTPIRRAYADVGRGELAAFIDSSGFLELAVNQGSAAARLDAAVGDRVELRYGVTGLLG